MKVLVYFKQDFFTHDERIYCKLKLTENIGRVFEAVSNEDLLKKFEAYNFIPKYLQDLDIVKNNLRPGEDIEKDPIKWVFGEKTMMWFLPENGTPYIEGELCAA